MNKQCERIAIFIIIKISVKSALSFGFEFVLSTINFTRLVLLQVIVISAWRTIIGHLLMPVYEIK